MANSPHREFLEELATDLNYIELMTRAILPKPFDGVENSSFSWHGGDHAALLLHGFPGTPAEMRPLATILKDAGWTVQGLMLPGMGADIATLDQRSLNDWSTAANQAMENLKRRYATVILIGYSMGGALALHTAFDRQPAALVLLAPFWSFGEGWLRVLWPLVHLLVRRVKPLQHADFSAVDVRRALHRMYPQIDLDDVSVQRALRQTTVSTASIAQVRQLGDSAFERAASIDAPTLLIQGRHDKVVRSVCTARLLKRLSRAVVQYHEVIAGHDLIDPQSNAWQEVKDCLLTFAESIREQSRTKLDARIDSCNQ